MLIVPRQFVGRALIRGALAALLAACAAIAIADEPAPSDSLAELAKAHPQNMARVYLFVQQKYPDLAKDLKAYVDKQYPDLWKLMQGAMQELKKRPKYADLDMFTQREILGIVERSAPNFQRDIRTLIDKKYPILWKDIADREAADPDADREEAIAELIRTRYPNLLTDIITEVKKRQPRLLAQVTSRIAAQYPGLMADLMTVVVSKHPKLPAEILKIATTKHPDLIPQIEKILAEPTPKPPAPSAEPPPSPEA